MKADPRERRDWLGVEVNVKWGAWGAILALKAPGLILERLGQQGWVGDDSKHSIQGMVRSCATHLTCIILSKSRQQPYILFVFPVRFCKKYVFISGCAGPLLLHTVLF